MSYTTVKTSFIPTQFNNFMRYIPCLNCLIDFNVCMEQELTELGV